MTAAAVGGRGMGMGTPPMEAATAARSMLVGSAVRPIMGNPATVSHRIRFRAGWTRHAGSAQTRVWLPDFAAPAQDEREVAADTATPVRYLRPFNCPSGLDDASRVDLVIESWQGILDARIDDRSLAIGIAGTAAPLRIEVTHLLRGHHQLWIDLTPADGQPPHLSGIAYLEIHPGASG